jgi:hypothetical protein
MFEMDIEYTNLFHSNALHNLPKLGFFGFENIPSGNPGALDNVAVKTEPR